MQLCWRNYAEKKEWITIDDMGIGIRVFGSGGMGLLKRVLNKSFMTCPDA